MLCKILIYLSMSRDWLRNLGFWILIPIMLATVTNKNAVHFFQLFY